MRHLLIATVAAACLIAVACSPPALADSMVFVKDNNVWLSNSDGSGQYQVTLDGTADAPYETPSEANDGTVVAIRQAPGQRRQVYRMTQSGGLLNPPINTPAPGTGAIDGKVSPDGTLVAYWFVTTVNDPLCTFCVNVSNRVLLSHSDRFTNADEVGTPNTGGWPSWLSNDTITLGDGSPTQWYYTLGMPEAAQWFTDSDLMGTSSFNSLLDAEVAPTGDRIAVVEGDNQENIILGQMAGPPPSKPVGKCALTGPTGKFVDPTWQSDGRLLAWQENDGVWTVAIPADLTGCALGTPGLRVPGAKNPDLSPAAINPGARPPCGNPGNPTACPAPAPPPPPGPVVNWAAARNSLVSLTRATQRALVRLRITGLRRKGGFTLAYSAPAAGTLMVQLTAPGAAARRATVLAAGRRVFKSAGRAKVSVKLTSKGRKRLRSARRLRATLKLTFKPVGASAISSSIQVRLKR